MTAYQAYLKTTHNNRLLLKQVKSLLEQRNKQLVKDATRINWGHVGDAHVTEGLLTELVTILTPPTERTED